MERKYRMQNSINEEKQTQWLSLASDIMKHALLRDSIITHDLSPNSYQQDEAELKAARKRVADLGRDINTLSGRLALCERSGDIGAKALGIDDDLARTSLAVLAIARLTDNASHDCRFIGHVTQLVGGNAPDVCLKVRQLFKESGLLFPHVWVGRSPVLDTCSVMLTESAFNRLVSGSDSGSRMCDAVGLLGRWDK